MSVAGDKSHDVKFESSIASPTTTLELMFATDEQGLPKWREFRLPPFAPRQSQGAVDYAHYDPARDLVWSQKSWHDGALAQVYHKDGTTDARYLEADGCDLRWEGVATLGMLLGPQLSQVIPNPSFELASLSGWTQGSGATATIVTTAPRTGSRHLSITSSLGSSGAYYDVPLSSSFVGRQVIFFGYARQATAGQGSARLQLNDNATTNSSNVSGATYTYVSITRTIGAGTTNIRLFCVAESTTGASYFDDVGFIVSSSDTNVGMAEARGKLYAATGPLTLRWNETNDFWEVVDIHASGTVATDIASFNDRIYVAYGYGASYRYGLGDDVTRTAATIAFNENTPSNDTITDSGNAFLTSGFQAGDSINVAGSTSNNGNYTIKTVVAGTITLNAADDLVAEVAGASVTIKTQFQASNRTAPDDKAGYFATRRDSLWKSETASGVANATAATNADLEAAWSTPLAVGSSSADITKLYAFQDSIVVGKENGLYIYVDYIDVYSSSTTLFSNVTEEFATLPNAENFARGAVYKGNLYVTTAQQGLYIFDGSTLVDATQLLFAPLAGHTGRVRALAADPSNLWMLVDVNTADATSTKEVWLYSLRERQGRFFIHTMERIDIGDINALAVNGGYLYAIGRGQNADLAGFVISTRRWTLPTKSPAPAFDATPAINTGGNFVTCVWDGGLPDENKAFISLTIFTKPSTLDANHTVVVDYKIDAPAAWTALATFSGTGAIQTKFFEAIGVGNPETNAVGRNLQLRFTLASNNTVSPELYAFALHSTLRPTRVRTWEMYFQIGEGVRLHNGQADPEAKATKEAALRTLEAQAYPIRMSADLNLDGTAEFNQFAVQIIPGTLELVPVESRQEGVEVWRVVAQEVTVA